MTFLENLFDKVQRHPKRIVFPEGEDLRIIQAASSFYEEKLGVPILLGNEKNIRELARRARIRLDHVLVLNPATAQDLNLFAEKYSQLRHGLHIDDARKAMKNPVYFGTMMLREGSVDGFVAGVNTSAALIIRPLFQLIQLQDNFKTACSCSVVKIPENRFGDEGVLYFADCNVIPNPSVEELADIALAAAMLVKQIHGVRPRVALLSFSDKGSAKHAMTAKIAAAAALARHHAEAAGIAASIDGELHADTALSLTVSELKNIKGPVAGKANVLIFPDLHAANISIKLLHEIAQTPVYGPILCGLKKPASDLMRNATAEEILVSAAIVALQAIEYRRLYPLDNEHQVRPEFALSRETTSWN